MTKLAANLQQTGHLGHPNHGSDHSPDQPLSSNTRAAPQKGLHPVRAAHHSHQRSQGRSLRNEEVAAPEKSHRHLSSISTMNTTTTAQSGSGVHYQQQRPT